MATSGEPVVTDAKVGQTSKPTADKFFKDFFTDVDFNGASGASASSSGTGSVGSDSDWLHVVNRARLTNLLKKRPENSKIFNWIERYVAEAEKTHPEFIRALVTIIFRNAAEGDVHGGHIDPKIIKQRVPVLQRYIDNKRHLELHALYAVQAFNHSLHNPPGLLRILFGVLYEEDVCSQESFYDWKETIPSQENPGKDTEYLREPEVLKESAISREIVQDVSTLSSEKTTQPKEDKISTEKTDKLQSDVAKRKNKKESPAAMPDTTLAKQELKEEMPDCSDMTKDREDVNDANDVESKNLKSKKGTNKSRNNKMQLKYSYNENQWSPINPEGKKQYDRDFLLQFQKTCTYKLDGLPNIPDIILDRAVVRPFIQNCFQGGNQMSSDFMPHFMKSPRVLGGKQPLNVTSRDSMETKLLTSGKDKYGYKHESKETKDGDAVKTEECIPNQENPVKEGKPNPKDQMIQLKYAYREDQWSPVNPDGKKQYDRDFLLQFQKTCTYKLDGLPNIPDVVLDRAVVSPLKLNIPQKENQKSSDFMPHFMKSPRVQPNYPTRNIRARDSMETNQQTSDKGKPGYKRGHERTKALVQPLRSQNVRPIRNQKSSDFMRHFMDSSSI